MVGACSTSVPGTYSDGDWDISCCERYVASGQWRSELT